MAARPPFAALKKRGYFQTASLRRGEECAVLGVQRGRMRWQMRRKGTLTQCCTGMRRCPGPRSSPTPSRRGSLSLLPPGPVFSVGGTRPPTGTPSRSEVNSTPSTPAGSRRSAPALKRRGTPFCGGAAPTCATLSRIMSGPPFPWRKGEGREQKGEPVDLRLALLFAIYWWAIR